MTLTLNPPRAGRHARPTLGPSIIRSSPSSAMAPPSSAIRHPSPAMAYPSSAIRHPSSAIFAFAILVLLAAPALASEPKPDAPETAGPPPNTAAMSPEAEAFWNSSLSAKLGAEVERRLLERLPERERPEWLLMFADILQGSQLGPNDGWFRRPTGGARFDWIDTRARYDRDGSGRVTQNEWPGTSEDFQRLDRDASGLLDAEDFDWSAHALEFTPGVALFYLADRDSNGKVDPQEFLDLFKTLDQDDLGFLAQNDFKKLTDMNALERLGRSAFSVESDVAAKAPRPRPGGPSKATLVAGLFTQEIGSLWPGPDVGAPAPDFTLSTVEGDREITLSEYREQLDKPIILVFGNFTCGPFRSQAGNVEQLYERYRDRAGFLMVYVREAHPTDGWHMRDNYAHGYTFEQPRTFDARRSLAETCQRTLDLDMPMLVDTIDDTVGTRYSGMPARLYLIDREGAVVYKSGRGPFGFKPGKLEQALLLLNAAEQED